MSDEEIAPFTPVGEDIERDWQEFWLPIVAPTGVVDMEQVKRELADFHMVMREVSQVYMHISGGRISKITTHAHHLISLSDDMCTKECEEETQALRERLERYVRVLVHTSKFLSAYPYWNLGKVTLPLHERMNEAWQTITQVDREYNDSVVGKNGERL